MKSHTSLVAQQTRLNEWADLIRDCQNRDVYKRQASSWPLMILVENQIPSEAVKSLN